MAITRSQYVTVSELQEILNDKSSYLNNAETLLKIYEASETLKAHCYSWSLISASDYTTATAPNDLKLATAYQIQYNDNNLGIDDDYAGSSSSYSLGKFSESVGITGNGTQEFQKIAPKAQRYLVQSGLLTRKF